MISESAIVCQVKPDDPKIVVQGEEVSLNWQSCEATAGETFFILYFRRQGPSSTKAEQIASRGANGDFTMSAPFKDKKKYDAVASQSSEELKIFNVQNNDEYVYTLAINYQTSGGDFFEATFQVTVDVKGKLKERIRAPVEHVGLFVKLTCMLTTEAL